MRLAIRAKLGPLLAEHKGTTALFLSGGADSLLLLRILLDMKADFQCVTLDNSYTKEQKDTIDALTLRFGLRVFSYKPRDAYLIGNGKRVSLVEEYPMVGGDVFPFVRDAVHDPSRCIHDGQFDPARQQNAPIGFTLNLFGTRKGDRHYSVGRPWTDRTLTRGNIVYHAPLWDYTRKQVEMMLTIYNEDPPTLDTGTVPLCTTCLTTDQPGVICPQSKQMVSRHDWDPEINTKAFRSRCGLER